MNVSVYLKSISRVLVILAMVVATVPAVYSQTPERISSPRMTGSLVEEFSFLIKDFRMDHQTQTNNLNISISFRYTPNIQKSEYPDFRWLAKDVRLRPSTR